MTLTCRAAPPGPPPIFTARRAVAARKRPHTRFVILCACKAVSFEVRGTVQGVSFREHTKDEAIRLGLVGWCKHTREGGVRGEVQGPTEPLNEMKLWLKKGSPDSDVKRIIFTDEKNIKKAKYWNFRIIGDTFKEDELSWWNDAD
mmetsp:Transcript_6178/g.17727  ORF Transcript_6178/g.17727 Transcript_6178/m.17727 type:complete len:145 (-) Transcript_6178:1012-1446(-)